MRLKSILFVLFVSILSVAPLSARMLLVLGEPNGSASAGNDPDCNVPPLVYPVENTAALDCNDCNECNVPPLPDIADLPVIEPLTDPFAWSDGSGRVSDFNEWRCRRAEIKAEIEHYEIGPKPDRPNDITASYVNGTLTVNITVNGQTLQLTSTVTLPDGDGPFPALIGIGWGAGSLPTDIFTERDIALVPFNFGQVMAHQQTRGSEPINRLYPELTTMGAYSAWSWGISRLIDGLELVQDDLPIDLTHLGVTGCSFAGKMALFAGALDERIALTIAQESGGGEPPPGACPKPWATWKPWAGPIILGLWRTCSNSAMP